MICRRHKQSEIRAAKPLESSESLHAQAFESVFSIMARCGKAAKYFRSLSHVITALHPISV